MGLSCGKILCLPSHLTLKCCFFLPVQQELVVLVVLAAVPWLSAGQGRAQRPSVRPRGREGKGGAERWPSRPAQTGAELLQSVNSK